MCQTLFYGLYPSYHICDHNPVLFYLFYRKRNEGHWSDKRSKAMVQNEQKLITAVLYFSYAAMSLYICYTMARSPGGGNGNPLQYSCLKNSMDRRAWQAAVHAVAKESDMTEQLNAQRRLKVRMHFSHSLIVPNNLLDDRSSCHRLIEAKNRGSMIRWI